MLESKNVLRNSSFFGAKFQKYQSFMTGSGLQTNISQFSLGTVLPNNIHEKLNILNYCFWQFRQWQHTVRSYPSDSLIIIVKLYVINKTQFLRVHSLQIRWGNSVATHPPPLYQSYPSAIHPLYIAKHILICIGITFSYTQIY